MISINCIIYSDKDDISNQELKYIMVKSIFHSESRSMDYNFDDNKKLFKYEIKLTCRKLNSIRNDFEVFNKPKKRHTIPFDNRKKKKMKNKNKIIIEQSLTDNINSNKYIAMNSNSD